ncbi:PI-PLC X domain-containing protein 1-like isoform X2 [Cololabis saira]|nr:PI-PLC X domain-containing protein 1-like isoform X2 [Cololabis saira]
MSYDLDLNSSIIEPDRLKRFSKIYCVRKTVRKWATTQEVAMAKQLESGVRYFDLRIARKPNDTNPTRLYFYHGLYTRTDVETVFKDIQKWGADHPKEILILALSGFKGFDKKNEWNLHNHLIHFIKNLFQAKIIQRTEKPTLKSCWDRGKNIIVSYDHPAYLQPALWGKINYYYGDSMDTTKIQSKLCHVLEQKRPSNCFFVCGLNLTLPNDARILKYILRLCDNLPNVIRRSLPRLLRWLNQQSAKTPVNIVASDLVTRDNFVSTVVKLNLKSAKA